MKKVALIIGHNARSKGGFSSVVGSEYDYWKKVAEKIKEKIPNLVDVYERKKKKFYTQEMREVLAKVNSKKYDCIIELHFNCASPQAHGAEFLRYWKNDRSDYIGKALLKRVSAEYGVTIRKKENFVFVKKNVDEVDELGNHNKKRKWKKERIVTDGAILVQNSDVRGGYGICKSRGNYILFEPFFGSNKDEAQKFVDIEKVAQTFATFIEEVE